MEDMTAGKLIQLAAQRREQLEKFKAKVAQKENQLLKGESVSPAGTSKSPKSSEPSYSGTRTVTKTVAEAEDGSLSAHTKRALAKMANAYESIDEEDSHSEHSTGSHKLQHPSHEPKPRQPARTSKSSIHAATAFPEKREHIPTGQSPYNNTKFPKTNTTPKKSDPAELSIQDRKAIFEKGVPDRAELPVHEKRQMFEKAMTPSSPEKPTASPRKNVTFADMSPGKDVNSRKHLFETAAARAQDPHALKKVEIGSGQGSARASGDFDASCVEGPAEIGVHTKTLQDKLLMQTKAWKHSDLSRKLEEEKMGDMDVLRRRWELMAEEEKRAAERGRLIQQLALEKKRHQPLHRPDSQTPPPLPIPGMSSLNDVMEVRRTEVFDFPAPVFSPPHQNGHPDAVARFNNPILRKSLYDDDMLPPPPPPLEFNVATQTKPVKHVRLPEEEGHTREYEEGEYAGCYVDDSYVRQSSSFREIRSSSASKNNYAEFSDEDISPKKTYSGADVRSPKSPKSPRHPHSENSSDGGTSSVSSTAPPISLSFYRKNQRETNTSPKKRVVIQDDQHSVASSEETEVERSRMAAYYQKKIDALYTSASHQHAMLIQTTTALNLCRSTPEFQGGVERAECERLLLLASKKRDACHSEINRLKSVVMKVKNGSFIPDLTCMGKVTISHIVMPTKEGFLEFIANETEFQHYFHVLFRHREIVLATQMVNTVQHLQQDGTFHFTGPLVFEDLENDFTMSVEVYAVQCRQERISHEEKYHLKNKSGKKKGASLKKLLPSLKEGAAREMIIGTPSKHEIKQSSFGCVGATTLTLQNIHNKGFELHKVPENSAVDGTLIMEITCGVSLENHEEGFLTIAYEANPAAGWHRLFCTMLDTSLYFWKYPEDRANGQDPLEFSLRYCKGNVQSVSSTVFPRPHTFMLTSLRPLGLFSEMNEPGPFRYYFSTDGKEERFVWFEKLSKVLTAIAAWIPPAIGRSASASRR